VSRSASERLQDIIDAIARARIADDRMTQAEEIHDDDGVKVAFESILHNLFVIGEAVKSLPISLLEESSDIPWRDIAALRDVIGHHYHRVVPAIIHRTVHVDLEPLEREVRELLRRSR
jgi:uncharacterized protein with HEPN domain